MTHIDPLHVLAGITLLEVGLADDRARLARTLASLDGPTVYDATVAATGFDPEQVA